MQESCKNRRNCLMSSQFEKLYGKYLGGTCICMFETLDYRICYKATTESDIYWSLELIQTPKFSNLYVA